MNYKKWTLKTIFISLLLFLIIGTINYTVDPFHQYRVKTFYPICYDDARNANAGFIKNYQYDSIILGTSMSDNFHIPTVEQKLHWNRVLKVTMDGAKSNEQSIILNFTLQHNNNLHNVLWGLDTFAFLGQQTLQSFPLFLYKNTIVTQLKYLLSIETLRRCKRTIKKHALQPHYKCSYNSMYEWMPEFKNAFTIQNVKKDWENRNIHFKAYSKNDEKYQTMKKNFDVYFLKLLQNNPNVNFTIFFPPYSILYYKTLETKHILKDMLHFKKYIFESTKQYKNIRIYDFQTATEITQNLSNYKDMGHYKQSINRWIITQITKKNYLVTAKNLDNNLKTLEMQTKQYQLVWKKQNE